ncbi:MAG TPA: prenyltransferase/squalene oxidase repeat-containing protein [Pirellulaceae bacterium]|jgi:hypothetical protein
MSATTTPATASVPPAGDAAFDAPQSWRAVFTGIEMQSFLGSMAFHTALMVTLALVLGTIHIANTLGNAPEFSAVNQDDSAQPELTHFDVGMTPLAPSELSTETLMLTEPPKVDGQSDDGSLAFVPEGGGTPDGRSDLGGLGFKFSREGFGPMLKGPGGLDSSPGSGRGPGSGGPGNQFSDRLSNQRSMAGGATKQSERAVAAALAWISRHQSKDGSWNIMHTANCKEGGCSGPGRYDSPTAATALGLLPFLAAGQTHDSKGPYQQHIKKGVDWLIKNQKKNGDTCVGNDTHNTMYSHGLATIALCEAYGMTQDPRVGYAAQMAIDFIVSGQNAQGGWRYSHSSQDSDTSIFGWQVMALKSGQMGGLKVPQKAFDEARKFLQTVARGTYKCEFAYTPYHANPGYCMTSVGLLTSQYLGSKRDDSVITNGIEYLLTRKPDLVRERNIYYWYYATQVMHNCPGPQWDEWNRHTRQILIDTQDTAGCATGSWDPDRPESDMWGNQGGRLMMTSLSALTLEVYYRYLPLYKLDDPSKKDDAAKKVENAQ